MSYDKNKLYKITHRLYEELRSNCCDITLKKMRGLQGEYDYNTDAITLDYRNDLISTLIHEYLHKWNPDKCETWVLEQERLIINALSTRQIINIIVEFGKSMMSH